MFRVGVTNADSQSNQACDEEDLWVYLRPALWHTLGEGAVYGKAEHVQRACAVTVGT